MKLLWSIRAVWLIWHMCYPYQDTAKWEIERKYGDLSYCVMNVYPVPISTLSYVGPGTHVSHPIYKSFVNEAWKIRQEWEGPELRPCREGEVLE